MRAVYRLWVDGRNARKMARIGIPARLRRCALRIARVSVFLVFAIAMAARVAAQQASGDYATDLGVVYAGYQRIIALKEACDEAYPGTRKANAQAYSEWQARHAKLLDELKRRVMAMIRRASSGEQDYARNLGKYEGAILLSREEQKFAFLTEQAETLKARCRQAPALLTGPEGDLTLVFARELETIRKRK